MSFPMQLPQRKRSFRSFRSRPLLTVQQPDGSSCDMFREEPKLPPIENFRLSNLLKAGVALDEVNTKIIGSSFLDLSNLASSGEPSEEASGEPSGEPSGGPSGEPSGEPSGK